jgi:chromosome partitioning protein
LYDPISKGAVSYLALASEVLRRNDKRHYAS